MTDLITFGSALPNGGRAFDFGEFSHGGTLCPAFTGQQYYLCASASARVEIDRTPVATTTYVGVATGVRLKAKARLDVRNASIGSGQIWGKASISIPLACNGSVQTGGGGLNVRYRLEGEHSVSVSDGAVTVNAPRPFETCDPGGVCLIKVPTFHCPEGAFTTNLTIDLWPIIQIDNPLSHTGWSVQAVSDYSHTFTLQGIDVLDANGDPMPGVRVVVPDGNGGTNDVFLTIAEAEEMESSSTTTTTTGAITTTTAAGTSTTTGASTTSTTIPPCATGDLAAASCRCSLRPVVGCDGIALRGAIGKGMNGLCAKVGKAVTAAGKKQRRLARQAGKIAHRTLGVVNGRKGNAVPVTCRDGLRHFMQAMQLDLATTPP